MRLISSLPSSFLFPLPGISTLQVLVPQRKYYTCTWFGSECYFFFFAHYAWILRVELGVLNKLWKTYKCKDSTLFPNIPRHASYIYSETKNCSLRALFFFFLFLSATSQAATALQCPFNSLIVNTVRSLPGKQRSHTRPRLLLTIYVHSLHYLFVDDGQQAHLLKDQAFFNEKSISLSLSHTHTIFLGAN